MIIYFICLITKRLRVQSFLMEEVLGTMITRPFSEVKDSITAKLTSDGERVLEVSNLLDVFTHETMFTTRELLEGMKGALEHMTLEEMRKTKLDTLEPDWDKMLNG